MKISPSNGPTKGRTGLNAVESEGTRIENLRATLPRVLVLVLSWRDPEAVARCLASLARQRGVPFEVEVIDNASAPDDVSTLMRVVLPPVRFVQNEQNLGYAGGMNSGLRRWLACPDDEAAPYALVLTQDMELPDDGIARLTAVLDGEGHLGAVGPIVRYREPPQEVISAGGTLDPRRLRVGHRQTIRPRPDGVSPPVAWLDGCAVLVRRRALKEAGLFDERFFLYFEDVDLGVRLNRTGWPPVVHTGVEVHQEKPKVRGSQYTYYMARNRFLFWALRFNAGGLRISLNLALDTFRHLAWSGVQVVRGEAGLSRGRRLQTAIVELQATAEGYWDALMGQSGPRGRAG